MHGTPPQVDRDAMYDNGKQIFNAQELATGFGCKIHERIAQCRGDKFLFAAKLKLVELLQNLAHKKT